MKTMIYKERQRNRQGIGLNIDDSCWNLDLLLEKEITLEVDMFRVQEVMIVMSKLLYMLF